MQISRVFFYYTVMKLAYFFERGAIYKFYKTSFYLCFHMDCESLVIAK
jgi:hypothetical protein